MERARQRKTIETDRGLFLVRAKDKARPPRVVVFADPDSERSISFLPIIGTRSSGSRTPASWCGRRRRVGSASKSRPATPCPLFSTPCRAGEGFIGVF